MRCETPRCENYFFFFHPYGPAPKSCGVEEVHLSSGITCYWWNWNQFGLAVCIVLMPPGKTRLLSTRRQKNIRYLRSTGVLRWHFRRHIDIIVQKGIKADEWWCDWCLILAAEFSPHLYHAVPDIFLSFGAGHTVRAKTIVLVIFLFQKDFSHLSSLSVTVRGRTADKQIQKPLQQVLRWCNCLCSLRNTTNVRWCSPPNSCLLKVFCAVICPKALCTHGLRRWLCPFGKEHAESIKANMVWVIGCCSVTQPRPCVWAFDVLFLQQKDVQRVVPQPGLSEHNLALKGHLLEGKYWE